jgi:hypothetical protein
VLDFVTNSIILVNKGFNNISYVSKTRQIRICGSRFLLVTQERRLYLQELLSWLISNHKITEDLYCSVIRKYDTRIVNGRVMRYVCKASLLTIFLLMVETDVLTKYHRPVTM